MDTLFIAGAWRPARDAGTRTIHCPADGREVVTVAEATEDDARDAVAAARARLRRRPLAPHAGPRAGGAAAPAGRPARGREGRGRPAGVARHRQAVRGVPDRRRRHRRPSSGTSPTSPTADAGRVVDTGMPDVVQPGRPRAGRRLLADHAVELPAAADGVEGRARAWRPATPSSSSPASSPRSTAIWLMRALAEVGPARRGRQPGARRRRHRRAPAGRRPGRRPGLLHRRPRDRPPDHGRGRGDREAGRARARRQEPQRGLRRRRPPRRDRQRAHRGLPRLRPGLLGRRAADRRGERPRPGRRRAGRAGASTSGSAGRSTTTPRPVR